LQAHNHGGSQVPRGFKRNGLAFTHSHLRQSKCQQCRISWKLSAAVASSSVVVEIGCTINRSRTPASSRRKSSHHNFGRPKRNDPLTNTIATQPERYNTKGARRLGHDAAARSCRIRKGHRIAGDGEEKDERASTRSRTTMLCGYDRRTVAANVQERDETRREETNRTVWMRRLGEIVGKAAARSHHWLV
jgi:hypothetical protein